MNHLCGLTAAVGLRLFDYVLLKLLREPEIELRVFSAHNHSPYSNLLYRHQSKAFCFIDVYSSVLHNPPMSRQDLQVNFRMPADLKARLEDAAAQNRRSTTAEVVARLEASFDREVAGTSFARPLALGDAESLLDAARAAFRKEQIALLTDQLIAEIELTAVRGEGTDFDLTMTESITENIDKLAALKGTDPLQEYAALMETVEKRLDEASAPNTGAKRIRRTRTPKT